MPKKKPKRRKSSDLRDDILAAAQEVFSERGYAAASTREIAERARAAEPLIFRHFEKKSKLFAAAVFDPIERTLDEHLGELRKMYNARPRSPIEGIRTYVEVILGTIRRNKRLFIAYLNAITFHAEDFLQAEGSHAPPSFQARLAYLERTSEMQESPQLVILDRHFEIRLILLFLCSVGLFDDLFFDALEQDDERVIRSVVKLLTMGVGVSQAEVATLKGAYRGGETPMTPDPEAVALKEENQKLRTLLTDAMLELHSLRNDRRRSAADAGAPVSRRKSRP